MVFLKLGGGMEIVCSEVTIKIFKLNFASMGEI